MDTKTFIPDGEKTCRTGSAAAAVMDRSVFRPLKLSGVLEEQAGYGQDLCILDGNMAAASFAGAVGGRFDPDIAMRLVSLVNRLALGGYTAVNVIWNIVFPSAMPERELSSLTAALAKACTDLKLTVCGAQAQISREASAPILSLTCLGRRDDHSRISGEMASEKVSEKGMQMVMAGWAAVGGMGVLARAYAQQLEARFPRAFMADVHALRAQLSLKEAAGAALDAGCCALHEVSSGGVLGALWALGERENIGFHVDLKKILIRQETVEICEYLDVNPYRLYGQGCFLAVTDRAQLLLKRLMEKGIPASVLGSVTEGRGRMVFHDKDEHYLEKPLQDELDRLADLDAAASDELR